MRRSQALILAAILAVLVYGVIAYHNNVEASRRRRDAQTVADCWDMARDNPSAVSLCEDAANAAY